MAASFTNMTDIATALLRSYLSCPDREYLAKILGDCVGKRNSRQMSDKNPSQDLFCQDLCGILADGKEDFCWDLGGIPDVILQKVYN